MWLHGAGDTMSRAGAAPMLDEVEAPRFGKTLTRSMLEQNERLGIPSWFVNEHGDRFHAALSVTGANGKLWRVRCVVRTTSTRARVYLGRGWLGFARENGLKVGDQVVFRLVARSRFHVLACGNLFSKDDDAMSVESPQHSTTNLSETQLPSCQFNCSPAQLARCVYFRTPSQRRSSHLPETEYVKYPGLSSAVSSNSRFPYFVKKLGVNQLHGPYMRLELPWSFVKEHGDKFQARVALLGAWGHLRAVNLRVSTFSGISRVHLGQGWKEFTLENGCCEGDVLLFSLVALSKFVVYMFPEAAN